MDKLLIIGALIGQLTVTSYRSVPEQTDDSPFYTSTNQHVHKGGCAVSRDLLCKACRKLHHRCKHPEDSRYIHYGDYLYVQGDGILQVNDAMGVTSYDKRTHKRYPIKRAIDIWCASYAEEKKFGVTKRAVFKLDIHELHN